MLATVQTRYCKPQPTGPSRTSHFHRLVADLDLTVQTSFAKTYNLRGHFGTFEAGFKFANAHRSQDATETVYDGWSTSASPRWRPWLHWRADSITPTTSTRAILAVTSDQFQTSTRCRSSLGNLGGDVDQYKTVSDTWPNIFHTIEQIPAGYVMNTIDFGALHLQTGVRFEQTNMTTSGYVLAWAPKTVANGTSATQPVQCPGNSITGRRTAIRSTRRTTTRRTWTCCQACRCAWRLIRTRTCARCTLAV